MLKRNDANPLLTPDDLAATRDDLEVLCTLKPGAVRFGDEILLLVRVGEKPRAARPGHVAYVRFDPETQETVVHDIPDDHPDLDTSDPRGFFLKGQMLLTSTPCFPNRLCVTAIVFLLLFSYSSVTAGMISFAKVSSGVIS